MGWKDRNPYEYHQEWSLYYHEMARGLITYGSQPQAREVIEHRMPMHKCYWCCRQMGWEDSNPYEYHPERGLYYHEVARNLICGSQPQTREDIEHLKYKESVTNIVNLQVQKPCIP